jgi:hypothetical protein
VASHGKGSKLFVAGYDFSGEGRSIDINIDVDTVDVSTFTSVAKNTAEGQLKAKNDDKDTYTKTTSGMSEWLFGSIGSQSGQPISVIPTSPVEGNVAYNAEIKGTTQKRPVSIEDMVGVDASFDTHGTVVRGQLVAYQQDTARGVFVCSGHPSNGLNSSDMRIVTVHVTEFNGTGNITLNYQASDDDTSANYATHSSGALTITGITSRILKLHGSSTNDWERMTTSAPNSGATIKYVAVSGKTNKQ